MNKGVLLLTLCPYKLRQILPMLLIFRAYYLKVEQVHLLWSMSPYNDDNIKRISDHDVKMVQATILMYEIRLSDNVASVYLINFQNKSILTH